jgi:hypothetical protein
MNKSTVALHASRNNIQLKKNKINLTKPKIKAYTLEILQEFALSKNGKLLSTTGTSTRDYGTWECSEFHEWKAKINQVVNGGSWCKKCQDKSIITHTKESILATAQRFTELGDWIKNHNSEYVIAKKNGWFEDVSKHLRRQLSKPITLDDVNEVISKCKSKKEFYTNHVSHYNKARSLGVLGRDLTIERRDSYTIEEIRAITKDIQQRSDFSGNYPAMYTYALRRGWLDDLCVNMKVLVRESKDELELLAWVQSLGLSAEKHYLPKPASQTGHHPEIDVFIKEKNIGIEYCGIYHHSDEFKNNNAHKNKMLLANSEGIRLITIFSDEWLNRKKQVKGFLTSILGSGEKINARDCEVINVDSDSANIFLQENHIQGKSTPSSISISLKYNGEIVGLITGAYHHRNIKNKKESLILTRLCFLNGFNIIGGASRLLSYFIQWAKENGFKKIISWSDNRWSEGNIYNKLGFKMEKESYPDYSYVKGKNRISKQSKNKKNLIKEGGTGRTEAELAKSLGYSRIYDCGKKRWIITDL